MINIDANNHVRGKSIYLDDIQEVNGTLYALPFDATVAHAKIKNIDLEMASKAYGVIAILTAKDIPGENQIGGIIPDEDAEALKQQGVAAVFQPGASLDAIVTFIRDAAGAPATGAAPTGADRA